MGRNALMQGAARGSAAMVHDGFPLRTVSQMTGLSPDLIRVWEKRYSVVEPVRGPRGARLYTGDDVTHLDLLARVVGSGRAIGDVARLGRPELERLAGTGTKESVTGLPSLYGDSERPEVVEGILAAVGRFDLDALDRMLGDAMILLGIARFVREVASPLLEKVGVLWKEGKLSVAEEHLLSGVLRSLLSSLIRARGRTYDPSVLLASPVGERHEFGLLLAALQVVEAGIGVYYLGIDLPAEEIATAARRTGVAAVGIGVVNGENRRRAAAELKQIEREIPPGIEIWLGGREAGAVARALSSTRALVIGSPDKLERHLERVRFGAGTRRMVD